MPQAKYAETQRKWKERNPDYYTTYRTTEKHREDNAKRVNKYYKFKAIQKVFLRILIND